MTYTTSLPQADPQSIGMDAGRMARVSPWLGAYVDEGKLAGANVAVIRDGHIMFRDHYGQLDIDSGAPMADDTIVRIYSMTEPLSGTAAFGRSDDRRSSRSVR